MTPCSSWVHHGLYTWYRIILAFELSISDVWILKMTEICHLPCTVDIENQGQTYFQMTFIISGWIDATDFDFRIDFNMIEVEELKKFKINYVAIIIDLENDTNSTKIGLTSKIEVKHQGQVIENKFSEIPNIQNVRIDTKIESKASIQQDISKVYKSSVWLWISRSIVWYVNYFNNFGIPVLEVARIDAKIMSVCMMFTTIDTKGHTQMCLTCIFKVNHQSQMTDFGFSDILDLVNVRIDTKIESVACIHPEIWKVIQWMCVTLSFKVNRQGHVNYFYIFDILDLENIRTDTSTWMSSPVPVWSTAAFLKDQC